MNRSRSKTAEAVQYDVLLSGFSALQAGVSERDDFVFNCLALLDLVNGPQCSHFSFKIHAAERVQLAYERQRDGMVDEIVTTATAAMQGQQVTMKTTDNGGHIARILNSIPIGSGLLLHGVGSISDGGSIRHFLLLGLVE